MFIVNQAQIDNIYNQLNGLEVYSFEGYSIIDPAIDVGDLLLIDGKYVIYQGSNDYGGKFRANILSKIQLKSKEETMVRMPSQKTINRRIESRIDQAEGLIEQTVEEVDEQNEKISRVTQTVDELNSKISDIADITTSKETTTGILEFEKVNQSEPIRIEIHPIGTNISFLYPRNSLYPSNSLFSSQRTIKFLNTDTDEVFLYELPTDLLYYDSENYDEFILDYDNQTCLVNKKVGYNADGTTYVLQNPQTIEYSYPTIELTDGDYTISLLGYNNAYLFVRLMAQNIYTTQFATKAEMNSAITQKADEINLSVDSKLSNYSTTVEMNSAINMKANEITFTVSQNYATKTQLTQTAQSISSVVSTKVGKDEVISSINQSAEQVQINANNIDFNGLVTANENFKILNDGSMEAKNGKFNGGEIHLVGGTQNNAKLTIESSDGNGTANIYPSGISYYNIPNDLMITMNRKGTSASGLILYADEIGGGITLGTNNTPGVITLRANNNSPGTHITCHGYMEATSYNYISLESKKKNIKKSDINALNIVKNGEIYEFNYKEEKGDKKHLGFIIPDNGGKYKTPNEVIAENKNGIESYAALSIVWKAIQELNEKIEKLEARI